MYRRDGTVLASVRLQAHRRHHDAGVLHRDRFGLRGLHLRHRPRMRGQRESDRSKLLRAHDISASFRNEHGEESGGHRADLRRREHLALRRRTYRDRVRSERRNRRDVEHVRAARRHVPEIYRHGFLQHVLAGSGGCPRQIKFRIFYN